MWQLIFCMFMNIMTTTCSQGLFVEQKIFRDRWMKVSTVRNIPKFKDRTSWSRDTFQPMRRRACVYQQTNQNIKTSPQCSDQKFSKQRKESDRISHRFEALRHILKTFHEVYTIFLSGQRIGSHIGSVSWNIQHILWLISSFKQRDVWARFWSVFKVGEEVSIIFSIHRFFTKF